MTRQPNSPVTPHDSLVRVRARVYDAPGQAANRAKLESMVERALKTAEDILDTGDPHQKLEAARIILQAWVKVAEMQVPRDDSEEGLEARLAAMFESPPPELRAHLEAYRRRENAKDHAALDSAVESNPKE